MYILNCQLYRELCTAILPVGKWYIYMLLLAGLLGAGGSGTDCNVFGAVQLRYFSGRWLPDMVRAAQASYT